MLFPNSRDPPTAMLDEKGNLVTSVDEVQKLTVETYRKRLTNRPMKEDLGHIRNILGKPNRNLCLVVTQRRSS